MLRRERRSVSRPESGKPSPKLAHMLKEAAPELREHATWIAAKPLAIRAGKPAMPKTENDDVAEAMKRRTRAREVTTCAGNSERAPNGHQKPIVEAQRKTGYAIADVTR